MRRFIRNFLMTITALLLLMLAAPLLITSDTLKQLLHENSSADADRFIEADELSLRLLPSAQLAAINMRMGDAATSMHADVAAMTISLPALLQGRVEPSDIQIQGVEIQLDAISGQRAAGRLVLEHINGLIQAGSDALPVITAMEATLYDGALSFDGSMSPQHGSSNIDGRVKLSGINLQQLLADIGAEPRLSGVISCELQLSGNLVPAIAQHQLHAKGPVDIRSGNMQLNGISAGYDRIHFELETQGVNHHLNQLQVTSPLINAAGVVHVSSGALLSGRIRTTGLLVSEMMLAGTVAKPALIPIQSQP